MTTAWEHYAKGCRWLAAAEKQPNTTEAVTFAGLAAAEFAAASAAVLIQANDAASRRAMTPDGPPDVFGQLYGK